MSLPILVTAYSGNECPHEFAVDEEVHEIAAVLDQWYELSAMYFKVQSTEGKTYLLRYDEKADEWTLQSGFDFVLSEPVRCPNCRQEIKETLVEPKTDD
jgi:hypothetical protein